jgi:tagatose 6-phosphate kinase
MITTVTLNASVDKAYRMTSAAENGTVMRVNSCRNSAGGKGLNVSRIVKLCQADVLATGFTGGYNGAYLKSLLTEDGIPHHFTHTKGETRNCINILDPVFLSTEYLEPGCEIRASEAEIFLDHTFPEAIQSSDVVTLSGSIPKGLPNDIYAKLIEIAKKAGKKVILDTSGDPLIEGIAACPTMIKPNKSEIENLTGVAVNDSEELLRQARRLHAGGIPMVVISLGGDGALMVCDGGVFKGSPPKIKVINTVGCGDSMVGAFAVAMERKLPYDEQLRYAVAVSAANAMSSRTGYFSQTDFETIYHQTAVEILQ